MRAGGQQGARIAAATALALVLAACGGRAHYAPVSDGPVRIGQPYTVRGVTYVPAANPRYDMIGYASWYGPESGKTTANGERFQPDAISAAHTTLPLPSYVEVTSLDTGRVILLRVNDRGPFSRGRIIDLSRGAAEQLGIRDHGVAPVRVRAVGPPESDKRRLREGRPAAERPKLSERELARLRARLAGSGSGRP